jgi:hypothetical protein
MRVLAVWERNATRQHLTTKLSDRRRKRPVGCNSCEQITRTVQLPSGAAVRCSALVRRQLCITHNLEAYEKTTHCQQLKPRRYCMPPTANEDAVETPLETSLSSPQDPTSFPNLAMCPRLMMILHRSQNQRRRCLVRWLQCTRFGARPSELNQTGTETPYMPPNDQYRLSEVIHGRGGGP